MAPGRLGSKTGLGFAALSLPETRTPLYLEPHNQDPQSQDPRDHNPHDQDPSDQDSREQDASSDLVLGSLQRWRPEVPLS